MRAGRLRTRLVYQTPATVDGGGGASHDEWTDAFGLWARLRPLKGDETVDAGPQVRASADHEVTCRHDPRIDSTGRFRIAGTDRTLAISAVADWETRGTELTVRCHETPKGA